MLKEVIISEGVKIIGESAFEYCSQLETVKVPKSIDEIKNLAFYACNNLKKISLPRNFDNIGKGAFRKCRRLQKKDFIIVKNILFGAYSGIDEAIIPEKTVKIDGRAFYECTSLNTVVIP